MAVKSIPLERVEWITESLLDPAGRVFRHEGDVYRAIYPTAVPAVEALFTRGIIADMASRGLLIGTERADFQLEGFGMVLRHRKLPFVTAATEWCRPLLRDAGRLVLDLNLALAEHGYGTIDAHPGNVGQVDCCRPVWLDLGSLAPLEQLATSAAGMPELRRFFTNPLRLSAADASLSRITRALNYTGGLSDEEAEALNGSGGLVWRSLQAIAKRARRMSSSRTAKRPQTVSKDERVRVLQAERSALDALTFPELRTTWGDYHPKVLFDGTDDIYSTPRRAAILRCMERLAPRRVIDVASNAGFYSFFAARLGAEVLAADYDEAAIERLYSFARGGENRGLNVTCACYDVTRPTVLRYPMPRQADLVLALALMHHLALSQGCSFSRIARLFAAYCTDALLVEFMPCGLGGTVPKPDPLPSWYTQDNFVQALKECFASVETVAEFREPQARVLLLARGPR